MEIIKKIGWVCFIILCIFIGLYPVMYLINWQSFGLLNTKSEEVMADVFYTISFYGHIVPGGISLLLGWSQFVSKWREKRPQIHRNIGKAYVIMVLISGICGIYVALFATGGLISTIGFLCLSILWLVFTGRAYLTARSGDFETHRKMMLFSYALCFAAVSIRFYLPIFTVAFHDFGLSMQISSWLCWVPNLLIVMGWYRLKSQK